jgi:hypothetical protein
MLLTISLTLTAIEIQLLILDVLSPLLLISIFGVARLKKCNPVAPFAIAVTISPSADRHLYRPFRDADFRLNRHQLF